MIAKGDSEFSVLMAEDFGQSAFIGGDIAAQMARVAIDITSELRSIVWRTSIDSGGWDCTLVVESSDWTKWSKFTSGAANTLMIRIQSVDMRYPHYTPWTQAYIDSATAEVSGAIMRVTLCMKDARVLMSRTARRRAWPLSTTASIVATIAAEYSLLPDVATTEDVPVDRWQFGVDDWAYITGEILDFAAISGMGGVCLWLHNGVLSLQAPRVNELPVRQYDFGLGDDRVSSFELRLNGEAVGRAGGAGATYVGFDMLTKTTSTYSTSIVDYVTQPASSKYLPAPIDSSRIYGAAVALYPNAARTGALHTWAKARERYYDLRMDCLADLELEAGSVISVDVRDGDSAKTFYGAGAYVVREVTHRWSAVSGKLTTSIAASRPEALLGAQETPAVGVSPQVSLDTYKRLNETSYYTSSPSVPGGVTKFIEEL
jgi:hypothetical protein